jgi:hypothetical protein
MDRADRKALHNFLLRPRRRTDDIWCDAISLQEILHPYGCRITPWEHPTLLDVGIDIYLGCNIRLIPTKKGYRVSGLELDGLIKSLTEIVCAIHKHSKTCY